MYDIILADPPWHFEVHDEASGSGRSPSHHYPTLTVQDILRLEVNTLANKNCALFLWTTWPHMIDAMNVIEAWGFTYRTLAWEWIKVNKDNTLAMGTGYYFRANPEPCLLAVKGKMPVAVHDEINVIIAPRMAYSQKPEEQYAKIARVYPHQLYPNRIELFARRPVFGWEATGLELDGIDISDFIDKFNR
jgi:N6-adenosine-specific RNA methylase IME4